MANGDSTLIIIEATGLKKTITSRLSDPFSHAVVAATCGRIFDFSEGQSVAGVDVMNPTHLSPVFPQRWRHLKKEAERYRNIVIATDPDHEGDLIAAHLRYFMPNARRVIFSSLSVEGIHKALSDFTTEFNDTSARKAASRRLVDRIIGYQFGARDRPSIGRVLTPTLAHLDSQDAVVAYRWSRVRSMTGRLLTWRSTLTRGGAKPVRETPKKPHILNCRKALEGLCSAFSITPESAEKNLQSLYQAGALGYYRTESETPDPHDVLQYANALPSFSRKSLDIQEHPAPLPLRNTGAKLSANDAAVYQRLADHAENVLSGTYQFGYESTYVVNR